MAGQSRRRFLQQGLVAPVVIPAIGRAERRESAVPRMVCEPSCLSEESAQGFRSVLGRHSADQSLSAARKLIVLPGASAVRRADAADLRAEVQQGAWVIWESSPVYLDATAFPEQQRILRNEFGIAVREPIEFSSDPQNIYVRHSWPSETLTRTFLAVVPVECGADAAIAHYGAIPVAAKRRIGQGGIIWLGSMLGPHMRAGDCEAQKIARQMCVYCRGETTRGLQG